MNDERTGAERMTDTQRPDERVDVPEQIDRLAEFLMEHTPVGIYGNMGAIEHAIAHITALQHERDAALARAERAEQDVERLRKALAWYANPENYSEEDHLGSVGGWAHDPGTGYWWEPDQGERARAALSAGADEEAE